MTLKELFDACQASISAGVDGVTLVLPHEFKRPPRFPRSELLCVNGEGCEVHRIGAKKLLNYVVDEMLAAGRAQREVTA